ncbi:MAG: hypothetical protein KKI08_20205 [Armatimonadetes bacterium]|nr:hypothetical protein [Armatimonadota bacterium]
MATLDQDVTQRGRVSGVSADLLGEIRTYWADVCRRQEARTLPAPTVHTVCDLRGEPSQPLATGAGSDAACQ